MRTLPLAALLLLACAGCKRGPSVVGKWEANTSGGTLAVEFKEDGGFAWSTTIRGKTIAVTGDYKLDGDSLVLTRKEIDAPGMRPEDVTRAKATPTFGEPLTMKVVAVSADEISLAGLPKSMSKGAVTLKRAKG